MASRTLLLHGEPAYRSFPKSPFLPLGGKGELGVSGMRVPCVARFHAGGKIDSSAPGICCQERRGLKSRLLKDEALLRPGEWRDEDCVLEHMLINSGRGSEPGEPRECRRWKGEREKKKRKQLVLSSR